MDNLNLNELRLIAIAVIIAIYFLYIKPNNRKKTIAPPENSIKIVPLVKKDNFDFSLAEVESTTLSRLNIINKKPSKNITENLSKFEKSYKSSSFKFENINDYSPLAIYGYKVGLTSPLSVQERKDIIIFTWHANLPEILPFDYRESWGKPGSFDRYVKIVNHFKMLASTRAHQKNMQNAVRDWLSDKEWLVKNHSKTALIYREIDKTYSGG